jgi:hypothetical protein
MMSASGVAKHYDALTPEERFRLILAAGARGDEAERARLVNTGRQVTLSLQDHAPHAYAFKELSLLTYLELTEDAAGYLDALRRPDDADGAEADVEQRFRLASAKGYLLKARADGWELFCGGLNIPPFLLWETLPGFDRLRRVLAVAREAAFAPEDVLRWADDVRPAEGSEVLLTAEGAAAATEGLFRQLVEWWGGKQPRESC